MKAHEQDKKRLDEQRVDLETRKKALETRVMNAEVVAEGYTKLPFVLDAALKLGARQELKHLLQALIDVVEWRPSAENPREGEALIQLFELPKDFLTSLPIDGSADGQVFVSCINRLPNTPRGLNSSTTFVIDLAEYKKAKRSRALVRPRICALLETAEKFQRQLDTGFVNRRSQLADYHGLTRARVTQILNLLKLAPEIRHFIGDLSPAGPRKPVTERQLRSLPRLSHDEQIRQAQVRVLGFADFLRQRLVC